MHEFVFCPLKRFEIIVNQLKTRFMLVMMSVTVQTKQDIPSYQTLGLTANKPIHKMLELPYKKGFINNI